MKRCLCALLACTLVLLAGCKKNEPADTPTETVVPDESIAVANDPPPEPPEEEDPDAGFKICAVDGLEVPIPEEYVDSLIIETELEPLSEHWEPLIALTERASVEAFEQETEGGEEDWGVGWLCSISRLDRIGFEAWVAGDDTGTSIFARDGVEHYYLLTRPTDVRLYRGGGAENTDFTPADMAAWSALSAWADTLPDEIIARNGLTPYDAQDLLDADYTYAGEHVELGCRFPGEPMDLVIFSLSQPAKQGEGGVWCVERMRYVYSNYNWEETHIVFPAALGFDMSAADYYAKLQAECDAGEHDSLLTPVGAALDYARRITWLVGEDLSASDLEVMESLG